MPAHKEPSDKVRLDKWLWAARFYKTRSQAAEAINSGKIHVNGARAKPAHAMAAGETLKIRRGPYEYIIIVRELSRKRGPASEAVLLYEETPESVAKREALAAQLKAQNAALPYPARRPNKRDRRRIIRFNQIRRLISRICAGQAAIFLPKSVFGFYTVRIFRDALYGADLHALWSIEVTYAFSAQIRIDLVDFLALINCGIRAFRFAHIAVNTFIGNH